jgi:hypothetical protein
LGKVEGDSFRIGKGGIMLYPKLNDDVEWNHLLKGPRRNVNEEKYRTWLGTCSYARGIMRLFEGFALAKANAGQPFGARALMERVRWEMFVDTSEDEEEGYKICNTHSPYIVRDLITLHPKLIEFISLKIVEGEIENDQRREGISIG